MTAKKCFKTIGGTFLSVFALLSCLFPARELTVQDHAILGLMMLVGSMLSGFWDD